MSWPSGASASPGRPDMDLTLSEDQDLLARTAASFVTRECPPDRVRALEATPDFHDPGLWRAMVELEELINARFHED